MLDDNPFESNQLDTIRTF